ncbi:hypothetical protein F4777DRAFT_541076 [Nemania sp. FL0916]|nr:hypothetical protein F4777DRAFT_541076 [Nemania sp. FL0916]
MSSAAVADVRQQPLSFMEKLDPLVSLYRPSFSSPELRSSDSDSVSSPTDHAHHPRLIIIASWTDARDEHIAKYVAKYQALYPAAQILLLKSTINCIINPSRIGPSMKYAADVVRAAFPPLQQQPPPPPTTTISSPSTTQLLIHIFSNGGSSSIANLYEQYAATAVGVGVGQKVGGKRLPPHVTIFDSSPGTYSIARAAAFFNISLSSFQRLLAAPIVYALAALWSASIALGFSRDVLRDWGSTHNNNSSNGDGGNAAEVRRVYIYSRSDALIDYRDVEAHAAEAESRGFSVALERYEGSAHVAHVRRDERRYWDIVERIVKG